MKYYCIKQHGITDCGAACLATICKQNGYKIGITKIREVAGTDKQGTNAYGVIKATEQLGFSAKGVKVILSILVDTFFSRISLTMLPVPKPHSIVCALSWEEALHWQSRSFGYSSS